MRVGGIVVLGIGLALGSLLTLLICPRGCVRVPSGLWRGGDSGFLRGPDTLRQSDTIWVWDTVEMRAHRPRGGMRLPAYPAGGVGGAVSPAPAQGMGGVAARPDTPGRPRVYRDTFRDARIRIYIQDTVAGSRILGRGVGYALREARVLSREEITRYGPAPLRLSPYVGAWGMGGVGCTAFG